MLIDFFFTLKDAKIPVSIKEYLILMEAMQKQVIAPSLVRRLIDAGEYRIPNVPAGTRSVRWSHPRRRCRSARATRSFAAPAAASTQRWVRVTWTSTVAAR